MKKVLISKQFVVQARDWINGLIIAVLSSILVVIEQAFDAQNGIDWNLVYKMALSGGLAYVIKNFISKPKVITTYEDNAKAEKVAEELR